MRISSFAFRVSAFIALCLCGSVACFAQFTTVTGTVTDVNGVAYACGTISAQLITQGGTAPTLNGGGFTTVTSPVQLGCPTAPGSGASGSFTMRLADNNVVSPSTTKWQFTVNTTGIAPPAGTGPQTCTATLTITGGSQSVSSSFAACPALSSSSGTQSAVASTSFSVSPNCGGQGTIVGNTANCGQVSGLLQYIGSCTWTAGNPDVSACPSGTFKASDVTDRGFGTNGTNFTNFITGVCQIGCTSPITISQFIDSTHVKMSANATGNSITGSPFYWMPAASVTSDDAVITTVDAAAALACAPVHVSGKNALGNGPLLIPVVTGHWQSFNPKCQTISATSVASGGYRWEGDGFTSSTFVLFPEISVTATFGAANQLFGPTPGAAVGGWSFQRLGITGGGNGLCGAAFNGKILFLVPGDYSFLKDVYFSGFCAGQTGVVGLQFGTSVSTGPIPGETFASDGFGFDACVIVHTQFVDFYGDWYCGDVGGRSLDVQSSAGTSGLNAFGGTLGPNAATAPACGGGGGPAGSQVCIETNAVANFFGTAANQGNSASTPNDFVNVGGRLVLDDVDATNTTAAATSLFNAVSTASSIVRNSKLVANAAGSIPVAITTGSGKIISEGGNTITAPSGGTAVSIASGTYVGNPTDAVTGVGSASGSGVILNGAQGLCSVTTPVTVSANVTTDQNLMSCTIPANSFWHPGQTLRLTLTGVYSTPAASTTAVTVKAKLGALTLATWTSTALAGIQATNDQFNAIGAPMIVTTAGSSGAFEAHGNMVIDLGVGNTVADSTFADTNTAVVSAVDLTSSQTLQITIAFSVASASNSATERQLFVETVN